MASTRLPVVGLCIGLCLLSVCLVIAFNAHGAFADEQYPEAAGDPSSGQTPCMQPESDSSVKLPASEDFVPANKDVPQVPNEDGPEVASLAEDEHEHAASRRLSQDDQALPEDSVVEEAEVSCSEPVVEAAGSDVFEDDDAPDGNSSSSSGVERRRLGDATLAPEGALDPVDPVDSADPKATQTVLPLRGGLDNTTEEASQSHADEKPPASESATEGGQQDAQTPADATEAGSLRRRLASGTETQTEAENETDPEHSHARESAFGGEHNELPVDSESVPPLGVEAPTEELSSSSLEGSRRRLADNSAEVDSSEDPTLQGQPSLRGATGAQQKSGGEEQPMQECFEESEHGSSP